MSSESTTTSNSKEIQASSDSLDTKPLDIALVTRHLGYPPPPEFEPLNDDFYADLKPGYPTIEGKHPESDIDLEIDCFYLGYYIQHPILLYASAHGREGDRFSRKVSWDVFNKYNRVFYRFGSSTRMRKTLLQKLNRYRKSKETKSGHSTWRSGPEREKEKELMNQILKFHDRIIDIAKDSGASKRPHKNVPKETKTSASPSPSTHLRTTAQEDDTSSVHSGKLVSPSSSSSSSSSSESPKTTSVMSITDLTSTSVPPPKSSNSSSNSNKDKQSLQIPQKRSWNAINNGANKFSSVPSKITAFTPVHQTLQSSPERRNGWNGTTDILEATSSESGEKFGGRDQENNTRSQSIRSSIELPDIDNLDAGGGDDGETMEETLQNTLEHVLHYMTEIKRRESETAVLIDAINTEEQMLMDQIGNTRRNIEMALELATKNRQYHEKTYDKILKLLKATKKTGNGSKSS